MLELKDVNKKLKDQYSRTRAMMEEAMEGRTEFADVYKRQMLRTRESGRWQSCSIRTRG